MSIRNVIRCLCFAVPVISLVIIFFFMDSKKQKNDYFEETIKKLNDTTLNGFVEAMNKGDQNKIDLIFENYPDKEKAEKFKNIFLNGHIIQLWTSKKNLVGVSEFTAAMMVELNFKKSRYIDKSKYFGLFIFKSDYTKTWLEKFDYQRTTSEIFDIDTYLKENDTIIKN